MAQVFFVRSEYRIAKGEASKKCSVILLSVGWNVEYLTHSILWIRPVGMMPTHGMSHPTTSRSFQCKRKLYFGYAC